MKAGRHETDRLPSVIDESIPDSIKAVLGNSPNLCHFTCLISPCFNLLDAIESDHGLEADRPEEIQIYGIEVQDINTFNGSCPLEVTAAIFLCVEKVVAELKEKSETDKLKIH